MLLSSRRGVAATTTAALHCATRLSSSSSTTGGGYRFFEDMYPKHDPAPRFAYYEDQLQSPVVKSMEPKKQRTESEKLHHLHEWAKDKDGLTPPPEFGWPEEWGPEPGEEGHSEWYKKNRMYMSYEEKSRYDLRAGVPVEKNSMRHQEMPYQTRMKAAYVNLEEKKPQYFDPRQRKYWAEYSYEDQRDTMAKARDDYVMEWLEEPGVTKENVAKKIADYNGTAKNQTVKSVQRRPEWELAPRPEYDDD
ncbi:hypothetical protein NESM_000649500 [Novymonas esmeraldas]|uniref:Uncharacterized protein n=1 Tax=Novymonas esmeraldas TaxID=1808958 RepID=A0AAW0ETJ2_9TRYP